MRHAPPSSTTRGETIAALALAVIAACEEQRDPIPRLERLRSTLSLLSTSEVRAGIWALIDVARFAAEVRQQPDAAGRLLALAEDAARQGLVSADGFQRGSARVAPVGAPAASGTATATPRRGWWQLIGASAADAQD